MDTFSSHLFENMSVPPECYPSETLNEYMNRESQLRHSNNDIEFDGYSDGCVDTSSSFSFNSSEYLNWVLEEKNNGSFCRESLGASLMQSGMSTDTHVISSQSSLLSDDGMSDFLPFDQTIRSSPQMIVDEEEERRYLSELLRQDMVAAELGWSYPETIEESCFERSLQDTPGDLFTASTWTRNNLEDNLMHSIDGLLPKGEMQNLYWDNLHCTTNPNSNCTARNPNNNHNSGKHSKVQIHRKENVIQATKAEKDYTDNRVTNKTDRNKSKSTDNDEQRVFLGGLPIGITERKLRQNLKAMGYKVLRRPKILHGFAPEVWMKTVDEAKDLIEKGTIMIGGSEVEVRPYNSFTKLSELMKLPNVGKRSVYMGRLPTGTTTKNLLDVLSEMGMKVINYPVIKHGFARQVILDTISQAKTLTKMSNIRVNGAVVDVRPFVNLKRRKRIKSKK